MHRLRTLFALEQPLRPTGRELWLTALAGLICLGVLRLRPPCLIQALLHIPCPTCGMTRAWIACFHLDLRQAFSLHPMFWSVPLLWVYILRLCRVFHSQIVNWSVLGALLLGYLIHYFFVLAVFFRPI